VTAGRLQSWIALLQPNFPLDKVAPICRSGAGPNEEGGRLQDTLILDKPEQLKALGHPLRVRVLEMLGQEGEWQLTNRELAQGLGVDPGHLHFHVRMLLKAGLIELADSEGRGREKPYRAVAKVFRVAPELLAAGGASDIQAAMIDQVQRAHALYSAQGVFRSAQLEVKLSIERALELMATFLEAARDLEDENAGKVVLTMFAHPPAGQD
jgi:DNA-binding transcriptional ArsR family regulator